MSLGIAVLFMLVVLIGVIGFYRSKQKKDLFRKHIDAIPEKEMFHNVRLYHYDAEGEAAMASDVCFVKGGFIVFSMAMSHYFFKKELENKQLSEMSSLCGFIKEMRLQDEQTLLFNVEFTKIKDMTSGYEYKLKFPKANLSLEKLLSNYQIR